MRVLPATLLIVSIVTYIFFSPYFVKNMAERPLLEKLGYTPQGKIYRSLLGEYKWMIADLLSFKSVIYYGGKTEGMMTGGYRDVELFNLYRTVETSILLNPYNEDMYYFAQGTFNWEVGQTKAINGLLKYVMKYRTWDYKLPYFLGFNYAYFLKDYENAAKYFQKAGEMTGSPLFNKLAARYFYEGGDTGLAVSYMEFMVKSERDEKRRKTYEIRLDALKRIRYLEYHIKQFEERFGRFPYVLDELVEGKFIPKVPADPYGGQFFVTESGSVGTTSELAEIRKY